MNVDTHDRTDRAYWGAIYGFCPACGAHRIVQAKPLDATHTYVDLICSADESHYQR